eukprot:1390539-Pleurochrysis_carterae.AAC.2
MEFFKTGDDYLCRFAVSNVLCRFVLALFWRARAGLFSRVPHLHVLPPIMPPAFSNYDYCPFARSRPFCSLTGRSLATVSINKLVRGRSSVVIRFDARWDSLTPASFLSCFRVMRPTSLPHERSTVTRSARPLSVSRASENVSAHVLLGFRRALAPQPRTISRARVQAASRVLHVIAALPPTHPAREDVGASLPLRVRWWQPLSLARLVGATCFR